MCWSLRIFQHPYLFLVQEQFLDVEFQDIHEHFSSKTDVQKLGWMHCPIEWTLDRCQHVQQEQNRSFVFKQGFLVLFQLCFYRCPCLSHVLFSTRTWNHINTRCWLLVDSQFFFLHKMDCKFGVNLNVTLIPAFLKGFFSFVLKPRDRYSIHGIDTVFWN